MKVDILDLSNTFDLGLQGIFHKGKLIGWKVISVF